MRFFNIAGPCIPEYHYMLPAEPRLPQARGLIDEAQFFVMHAPRQSGKTTILAELTRNLTAEGRYAAIQVSCAASAGMGDNYLLVENTLVAILEEVARQMLPSAWHPAPNTAHAPAGVRLMASLRAWAARCPVPIVLGFDEIDALHGQSLHGVLHQLRDGYLARRDIPFVHSVILCGLRDLRDYKIAAGGNPDRLGSPSPFNISAASMRIEDFTFGQIHELYAQHTAQTGQEFTDEAVARVWEYTAGQPWLVNALAREVRRGLEVPDEEPVTAAHIEEAKERLIRGRVTHLGSLTARLQEPRVRRVMDPLIAGTRFPVDDEVNEDLEYLRDLGLLALDSPVRVANSIYREVIVRVLGAALESNMTVEPRSFVRPDGRLDFDRLLREFVEFWIEDGEILASGDNYHESAPQLVLMAFLRRIVNGGGFIDREYGAGRGRVDLLVRWPHRDGTGARLVQREALELKVWRPGQADPVPAGLKQLDSYLQRLSLDRGTLIVFDRRPTEIPLAERVEFLTASTPDGRAVTILRAQPRPTGCVRRH